MTESQFQAKLLKALRSHATLKDAVIWKTNDRTTGGIPDIIISEREGRTTFWEVKLYPNHPTKLQAYYLNKLRFSWCIYFHGSSGRVRIPPRIESFSFKEAVEEIIRRCVDA